MYASESFPRLFLIINCYLSVQPKAFIAATAEFENGSNLTLKFVGDEKYSNPPGVVPEKPGFSPDFNETGKE